MGASEVGLLDVADASFRSAVSHLMTAASSGPQPNDGLLAAANALDTGFINLINACKAMAQHTP